MRFFPQNSLSWSWAMGLGLTLLSPPIGAQNLLIVDSSFAPIKTGSFSSPLQCELIQENSLTQPGSGPCFDQSLWEDVGPEDVRNLKGLQDSLAGFISPEAKIWQNIEAQVPSQAQRVKEQYLLAAHGTRSALVAHQASGGLAQILFLRNLSSVSASAPNTPSTPLAQSPGSSKTATRDTLAQQRYPNGCPLVNWSPQNLVQFQKGKLLSHQEKISALLQKNPSIRVLNLSIGYKKRWIQEDNPQCDSSQVEKEFAVLVGTWRNLLKKHPQQLFVVAAGNESENFDDPRLGKSDLWAVLDREPNLLIIGSRKLDGTRLPPSNFGSAIHAFAQGERIGISSPIPGKAEGHITELRGTSFSAPIVAGKALAFWVANPQLKASQVKLRVLDDVSLEQRDLLLKSLEVHCQPKKQGEPCLDVLASFLQSPALWGDTTALYQKGKSDWQQKPFPIIFDAELKATGELRLENIGSEYVPGLRFSPDQSPQELLITLHHEIFHYAQSKIPMKDFFKTEKIQGCANPYHIALLREEPLAFYSELKFYESAPEEFRAAARKQIVDSQLLKEKLNLDQYYTRLKAEIAKDPNFVIKRYVDMGRFPSCILKIMEN